MSLKSTIDRMRRDNSYSPDIGWLSRKFAYVPVFVYGAQMRFYSQHDLMQGFPRVGVGTLVRPRWVMYECDHEPIIFDQPQAASASVVKGEIYVVPPEMLFALDGLYCRGIHFYRRMEVVDYIDPSTLMAGRSSTHFQAQAFVYVGIDANWQQAIESGRATSMSRWQGNSEWYYRFQVQDDKPNRIETDAAHTHVL